jgi:hypothetical protein
MWTSYGTPEDLSFSSRDLAAWNNVVMIYSLFNAHRIFGFIKTGVSLHSLLREFLIWPCYNWWYLALLKLVFPFILFWENSLFGSVKTGVSLPGHFPFEVPFLKPILFFVPYLALPSILASNSVK